MWLAAPDYYLIHMEAVRVCLDYRRTVVYYYSTKTCRTCSTTVISQIIFPCHLQILANFFIRQTVKYSDDVIIPECSIWWSAMITPPVAAIVQQAVTTVSFESSCLMQPFGILMTSCCQNESYLFHKGKKKNLNI